MGKKNKGKEDGLGDRKAVVVKVGLTPDDEQ